ncbi:MAG TPA: T9SS type A sorting domain-containing protein [Chitinophagales bacterium]|nr:T9SS type A sorting domain-containing protein [Chitinophagales bacterium]
MKKIFLLIVLASFGCSVFSQNTFMRQDSMSNYGIGPGAVKFSSDGGLLVGSFSGYMPQYPYNAFLFSKLNSEGEIEWEQSFGVDQYAGLTMPSSIGETIDGGYFLACKTYTYYGTGCTVAKYTHDGAIEWVKNYYYPSIQYDIPRVIQGADGSYIITLSVYSHMVVIKADDHGNMLWSRSMDAGDSSKNPGFSSVVNADGSIVTIGKSVNYVYVVAIAADGTIQWTKNFLDASYSHANAILRMPNGDYLIAGYKLTNQYDGFIMRIDALGNLLWNKLYRATSLADYISFNQLFALADGSYMATGLMGASDPLFLIFSDDGSIISGQKIIPKGSGYYSVSSITADINTANQIALSGNLNYLPVLFKIDQHLDNVCGKDTVSLQVFDAPPATIISGEIEYSNGAVAENLIPILDTVSIQWIPYCDYNSVLPVLNEAASVELFPNPASSSVNIHFPVSTADFSNLIIADMSGKELIRLSIDSQTDNSGNGFEVSTAQLSPGIYTVTLTNAAGISITKKLAIMRSF